MKLPKTIDILYTSRADYNMLYAVDQEITLKGHYPRLMHCSVPLSRIPAPDACIVLGDRMELLDPLTKYVHAAIPIIHLHAEEETTYSADNRYRKAISCLASLTIPPEKHGAIGYELATTANLKPVFEELNPYALITLHPWLKSPDLDPILKTITDTCIDMKLNTVICRGNGEPGSITPSLKHVSLGESYYAAMKHAAVIIGNSSSMIFEAAAYDTPCILVGPRQEGRNYHGNINHVAHRDMIEGAIRGYKEQVTTSPAKDFIYGGENPIKDTVEEVLAWL